MNAAGLAAKTEKPVTNPSVGKTWGKAARNIIAHAPGAEDGYLFSKAMTNPGFISVTDIQSVYRPMGFSNFKIEGRGLGSALILEFLLILYGQTRIPDPRQGKDLLG